MTVPLSSQISESIGSHSSHQHGGTTRGEVSTPLDRALAASLLREFTRTAKGKSSVIAIEGVYCSIQLISSMHALIRSCFAHFLLQNANLNLHAVTPSGICESLRMLTGFDAYFIADDALCPLELFCCIQEKTNKFPGKYQKVLSILLNKFYISQIRSKTHFICWKPEKNTRQCCTGEVIN